MRSRPRTLGSGAPNRAAPRTRPRTHGAPTAGSRPAGSAPTRSRRRAVEPPSSAESRRWTLAAWALVALFAAGLVFMIAGPHRVGDYFTETDFYGAYAAGARLVQHGRLLPERYSVVGPGYEVALALAGLVVRDLFLAAELLSVLSAVTIVLAWHELLRRRADARVAGATVALLVTNGYLFQYGYSVTTDAFAIALESVALFLLLAAPPRAEDVAEQPSRDAADARRVAAAGLVTGLAFLTRYNAVALFPAGLIAVLAGWSGATRRGRAMALLTAGFLVPVVPWVAYSLAHGGRLTLQLHHNIAYEVFARARGIPWDEYQRSMQSQFPNLAAVIARDPAAVASRMLGNVGRHLQSDAASLLGWPVAVAAIAGIVLTLRDRSIGRLAPLLVAGGLLFATLVPVFYSERYSLALLPIYAALAGAGCAALPALLGGVRRSWWVAPVAAALVIGLAVPAAARRVARTIQQLPEEVLAVGARLRELHHPGDRVIARKAHIGYYGDCEALAFPFADSLVPLGQAVHARGARWMYFSWPEAETRPAFWYLLDTSAVVPGLTARAVTYDRPAVLYEVGPQFGETPAWVRNDTLVSWHVLRAQTLVDTVNADLWRRFGEVAWLMRRYADARVALERAGHLRPSDAGTFVTLGRADAALGRMQDAYDAFGRAYALDPGDVDTRVAFGFAAYLIGHEREAADLWRPAIGMTVDARVLRAMADVYARLGDAQALEEVRRRMGQTGRS